MYERGPKGINNAHALNYIHGPLILLDVHRFRWVKYDMDGTNPVDLDVNDPRVTLFDGNLEIGNPKDPNVESQQLVSADDEGVYQCIAENIYGSALSKKMKAQLACKYGNLLRGYCTRNLKLSCSVCYLKLSIYFKQKKINNAYIIK